MYEHTVWHVVLWVCTVSRDWLGGAPPSVLMLVQGISFFSSKNGFQMPKESEVVHKILQANREKPFVKRMFMDDYPAIQNPDGSHSTHSMAWGEADGRNFVYPTVMMGSDGKLQRFSPDEAFDNALNSGNFIEFSDPKKADWFSRNYKKIWGFGKPRKSEKGKLR